MEQDIKELYRKVGLVVVIVAIIQGIALFAGPAQPGVGVSGIRANPDNNIPELRCAPPVVLGKDNEPVGFAASGGMGLYVWSAPGGTPADGTGTVFATRYPAGGPRTRRVTVSSGQGASLQQSSCIVTF